MVVVCVLWGCSRPSRRHQGSGEDRVIKDLETMTKVASVQREAAIRSSITRLEALEAARRCQEALRRSERCQEVHLGEVLHEAARIKKVRFEGVEGRPRTSQTQFESGILREGGFLREEGTRRIA